MVLRRCSCETHVLIPCYQHKEREREHHQVWKNISNSVLLTDMMSVDGVTKLLQVARVPNSGRQRLGRCLLFPKLFRQHFLRNSQWNIYLHDTSYVNHNVTLHFICHYALFYSTTQVYTIFCRAHTGRGLCLRIVSEVETCATQRIVHVIHSLSNVIYLLTEHMITVSKSYIREHNIVEESSVVSNSLPVCSTL